VTATAGWPAGRSDAGGRVGYVKAVHLRRLGRPHGNERCAGAHLVEILLPQQALVGERAGERRAVLPQPGAPAVDRRDAAQHPQAVVQVDVVTGDAGREEVLDGGHPSAGVERGDDIAHGVPDPEHPGEHPVQLQPIGRPAQVHARRASSDVRGQLASRVTFSAAGPFWACTRSNSTRSPWVSASRPSP
jgi:hypothetical protein